MFETHSVDKTAHLARIRLTAPGSADYPEGVEERGWSLTHSQSRYSRLGIHSSIAEQAEWLERRAPAYLATYPSTAAALARHLEERAGKIPLRAVITAGETVDDDTRDDVRRAFGCEIIDRYATEEIGHIASQCPAGGGYHVCIEAILLELVDRDGNDVAPGERGRVVLTSLYNFAMPFIRYDIGDLAVAAEGPCRCGSSLPRLEAILGRQRSVFTFPDGSQYSPWKWRAIFRPHIHAVQIQLVQTEADRIEVRYVPRKGASLPDADLIERLGRSAIHPNVIVKAVTVEEIPRHPSGKMPDCISLVTPA
jgi:phenylacetate-CoA ligase